VLIGSFNELYIANTWIEKKICCIFAMMYLTFWTVKHLQTLQVFWSYVNAGILYSKIALI